MKISKIMSFGLAGLIAFIWMGSVTYAAETVRGVTADSIRIGVSAPLSKVLASEGRQSVAALEAYAKSINDSGGIHGRKIVLIVDDSQLDPGITLGIWKKQLSIDNIFAHIVWGTPPATVLVKPAMDEQVPILIAGVAKSFYNPTKKYVFCFQPPYEVQAATCVGYIHDVLKKKDAKIAIMWRNDEYGKTALIGGRIGAKYYGHEIVAEPSYLLGQALDFTAEVMKIKRAKADFILWGGEPGANASFQREVKNQGLNARVIGAFSAVSDRKLIAMAGDAIENYTTIFTTATFKDTDIPGVRKMLDISKRYASADILSEESYFYLVFWHTFAVIEEALRMAGPNLNQETFVNALESIKGFTAEGLGPPITFSPTKHYSAEAFFFAKVNMKIKDYERITDWIRPPQGLVDQIVK